MSITDLKPMSEEEFNERIDQSELDFKEGMFKTSEEIKEKYRNL